MEEKKENQPLKELLKEVHLKGFNIYKFNNRLLKRGMELPEEVLIKVCQAFLRQKNVVNDWAWFTKVVAEESKEYFAQKNIKENEKFKKEKVAEVMKDILGGIGK